MTQDIPHSGEATARVNDIDIVYDTFGDPNAPAILLIMGLGAQMISWDGELCAQLASHGYWVIRYDNRDIGLSTKFDNAGTVNILEIVAAMQSGQSFEVPYNLRDMADDAVGLLDALEIQIAHVVGASMGGMIAQLVAIHYPSRVSTLTSIMSSTGEPDLPPPSDEAFQILLVPTPTDRDGYIEASSKAWNYLNGPRYQFDENRLLTRIGNAYDRGLCPDGVNRQLAATITSEGRREALQSVAIPTLVIHGDADPLVPVEGGIDTAEAIPGAKKLIIEGMGHSLPDELWHPILEAIVEHTSQR
jgi:pimeloyl-ACP methyl ester carboxylesterase